MAAAATAAVAIRKIRCSHERVPPDEPAPQIVVMPASPAVVVGGHKSEKQGTQTATSVQVEVTGSNLLSSVVTPLTGATANVIAIEL